MNRLLRIGCSLRSRETEAVLNGLHAAFEASPVPACPMRGVLELSAEEREAWQVLQSRAAIGSVAEAEISCLLAYFGVNVRENTARLLRTWSADLKVDVNVPRDKRDSAASSAAGHLARLYDRWRDPHVLERLIDRQPPGGVENGPSGAALLALWDSHWETLLRVADGSPRRVRRLADALLDAWRADPRAFFWRFYMRHLRLAVTGRDDGIRRASLAILTLLRFQHPPKPGAQRRP